MDLVWKDRNLISITLSRKYQPFGHAYHFHISLNALFTSIEAVMTWIISTNYMHVRNHHLTLG